MPRYMRPGIALAITLALVGCSACATTNSGLKSHTTAAQTLEEVADEARQYVLDDRKAELEKVAAQAVADKLDPVQLEAAVKAAAATYDDGPKVASVNAFIAAKDLYVRAVLQAASKDTPSWSQAKAMLKDVVDAYTNLRQALGNPKAMPPLPDAIAALLSRASPPGDDGAEVMA